jgi:hypothetical protein
MGRRPVRGKTPLFDLLTIKSVIPGLLWLAVEEVLGAAVAAGFSEA